MAIFAILCIFCQFWQNMHYLSEIWQWGSFKVQYKITSSLLHFLLPLLHITRLSRELHAKFMSGQKAHWVLLNFLPFFLNDSKIGVIFGKWHQKGCYSPKISMTPKLVSKKRLQIWVSTWVLIFDTKKGCRLFLTPNLSSFFTVQHWNNKSVQSKLWNKFYKRYFEFSSRRGAFKVGK